MRCRVAPGIISGVFCRLIAFGFIPGFLRLLPKLLTVSKPGALPSGNLNYLNSPKHGPENRASALQKHFDNFPKILTGLVQFFRLAVSS
jgi:hypothetical protein